MPPRHRATSLTKPRTQRVLRVLRCSRSLEAAQARVSPMAPVKPMQQISTLNPSFFYTCLPLTTGLKLGDLKLPLPVMKG